MTSPPRRAACMATLVLLVTAGRAAATVVLPADLDTLVRVASLVVYGRVVSIEPRLVDGRRRIERVLTLEVAECYKGGAMEAVELRVPGGQFGSLRTVTIGAPRFRVGEEVVLFLGGDDRRGRYPIGLWQGVFRVRRDPALSSGRLVSPAPVLRNGEATYRVLRGDGARSAMRLDDFAAAVRQLASSLPTRGPAGRKR